MSLQWDRDSQWGPLRGDSVDSVERNSLVWPALGAVGSLFNPHRHGPWSGMRPTRPREEGGGYPVRANAQVNTDVGPDEVGMDLRLSCPHHLI